MWGPMSVTLPPHITQTGNSANGTHTHASSPAPGQDMPGAPKQPRFSLSNPLSTPLQPLTEKKIFPAQRRCQLWQSLHLWSNEIAQMLEMSSGSEQSTVNMHRKVPETTGEVRTADTLAPRVAVSIYNHTAPVTYPRTAFYHLKRGNGWPTPMLS